MYAVLSQEVCLLNMKLPSCQSKSMPAKILRRYARNLAQFESLHSRCIELSSTDFCCRRSRRRTLTSLTLMIRLRCRPRLLAPASIATASGTVFTVDSTVCSWGRIAMQVQNLAPTAARVCPSFGHCSRWLGLLPCLFVPIRRWFFKLDVCEHCRSLRAVNGWMDRFLECPTAKC